MGTHLYFDAGLIADVRLSKWCVPLALRRCSPAAQPSARTTGPQLPAGESATVRADPVVSAGLPVQLRIRSVDGREVGISASKVELPPGSHALLVDCRVAESGSVRRFTVEADLESGRRYRLEAERHGAKL